MASNYFNFKQFTINQERSAFKVGTDGVLLGAYTDVSGAKRILDIGSVKNNGSSFHKTSVDEFIQFIN